MIYFLDANICLDLLDTNRPTSPASVKWYLDHKDEENGEFYFSADFISTMYYILTEKRNVPAAVVIEAIEALSEEIAPFYLSHRDFLLAKERFFAGVFEDFEDMLILESASRAGTGRFVTHDRRLAELRQYGDMQIIRPQ